ncbi:ATP-dependent nuclease [Janibacter limosus]|uniref:ATP-dependent nuclease n=1 Tax=Janibacter limosus TaxID=53458 RepID=UPI000830A62F|nr:AAA family ATPase [Janibacter limosus]
MNLETVTIRGFQSFGPEPITLAFDNMTFLLGPNGSGKTAVLHALARMFAVDPSLRGLRKSDFHVGPDGTERELFIEARFTFPEAGTDTASPAIPEFLTQMQLESTGGTMAVLIRLSGTLDDADEIEEDLLFIRSFSADGSPEQTSRVDNFTRRLIQLHYLPARRNPREHISYAPSTLLGNALRAVDWTAETGTVDEWNRQITEDLSANAGISTLTEALKAAWSGLHRGSTLASPAIGFGSSGLDHLLRQLTVNFTPDHAGESVGFDMLSDGQQSLLYVSTVIALHEIGKEVMAGVSTFDESKLRPPVYTLFAVEEPENSLSPYYLSRIFRLLRTQVETDNCQAAVATHSPSVVKRVDPENIRFLRLDRDRRTLVRHVELPAVENEARKYVKQAVEAFPELYFARLVVLGEGASEEVVIPRILNASGTEADELAVAVVPLGGRHVNHMWRLLNQLQIPHITLLDLDRGRFGGGWGRIRTALRNLQQYVVDPPQYVKEVDVDQLPAWHEAGPEEGDPLLVALETADVFFSGPLDLDFLLLEAYPDAFPRETQAIIGDTQAPSADAGDAGDAGDETEIDEKVHRQVLGKKHTDPTMNFTPAQLALFDRYHAVFQLGSKPTAHLEAMSNLDGLTIDNLPPVLRRLVMRAASLVAEAPE